MPDNQEDGEREVTEENDLSYKDALQRLRIDASFQFHHTPQEVLRADATYAKELPTDHQEEREYTNVPLSELADFVEQEFSHDVSYQTKATEEIAGEYGECQRTLTLSLYTQSDLEQLIKEMTIEYTIPHGLDG